MAGTNGRFGWMSGSSLDAASEQAANSLQSGLPEIPSDQRQVPAIGRLGYGDRAPLVRAWIFSAIASAIVFSVAAPLDLSVSRIFYRDGLFPAAQSDVLETIRLIIWSATAAVAILSLCGLLVSIFRGHFMKISKRIWGTVLAIYILGPGLMANILLKSYWGRARPVTVGEFGGTAEFTPALLPADQCAKNCSFISGEGSGAVALAVGAWFLTGGIQNARIRSGLRAIAIAAAITGSLLRVAFGRHFLSDVIFAALIVTGLALILRKFTSPFEGKRNG